MTIDTELFVARGVPPRRIVLEARMRASDSAIFERLTTSSGVRAMFGIESNIELRIGGAYEWLFDPSKPAGERGGEGCQILAYLPPSMLAFSWNAPPHLDEVRALRTWVVVTLAPEGDETRVSLTHLGFGEGGQWDDCHAYFQQAWPKVLAALEASFA